ncbi:Spo0B domain-containing protein [Saccharibacillus deserti]|uniref:Spo0B domain-containing protein n=1 Tax=Saccharibacillus deserti TaxID=1634444 RepID=UPI001554D9B5|nr:Spo0B domain-containing protein [Saccharibacillus deserti]
MRRWRDLSVLMPLSTAIPWILAWIFPGTFTFVLLGLWLAAVFFLLPRQEKRRRENELHRLRQSLQNFFLNVLSHQRHDWMNDLQLIFGYSRMGKTDRIEEIITRVSGEMHKESRIAKLGLPEFVFYLTTVKGENREVALHVKADEELCYAGSLTPEEEEGLIRAVRAGLSAYRYSGLAAKVSEPALRIVFGEESGEATLFIEPENDPQAVPVLHRAVQEALESYSLLTVSAEGGTLIRWKLPVQT